VGEPQSSLNCFIGFFFKSFITIRIYLNRQFLLAKILSGFQENKGKNWLFVLFILSAGGPL